MADEVYSKVLVTDLEVGDLLVFSENHWFLVLGLKETDVFNLIEMISLDYNPRGSFNVFKKTYDRHCYWPYALRITGR